ncbi:MAG: sulfur relay protein DsrC [Gammaproteobacteria bacterium]|nr:sulfur relay protein DsrC [Gammaproteobacteria bacterium]MDH5593383.1 sulfur relay protein DsrC [Gammaproteobacteria bacterium]
MLYLSEILMQHHEINTFEELLKIIPVVAKEKGEIFMHIDVKPQYADVPANWEDKLEGAFAGVHSVTN